MKEMKKNYCLILQSVLSLKIKSIDKCFSTKKIIEKGPRTLTLKTLNPQIRIMEYAVRGALVIRAAEIEGELKRGVKKPFKEVIRANIGDCHAMGQIPITFIRQVLALVSYPKLLDDPQFPEDAKSRARLLLEACRGGSIGSYTDAAGLDIVRKDVADYVEQRDGGISCDWRDIILTSGASDGIKNILKLMVSDVEGKKTGVMVPIPQYPLYSASLAEFNLHQISYYLDESDDWALTTRELERAIDEAEHISRPQAIVVINPGNPTGQVLTRKNIEEIIKFAYQEKLFLLADEVYQHNVYAKGSKFESFKKILTEMGKPYSHLELASFMSCSKGFMGECGLRGGFTELVNLDPRITPMFWKVISTSVCPSIIGQIVIDVVVNPPKKGDPSYNLFMQEKKAVLDSLKLKAKMVEETFNSFQGFHCNPVQGAMYAFPQIKLPPKAIKAAKLVDKPPDVFYAFQLLENTGICIIPGTGFGQAPGTYHFRTTILPQVEKLKTMLDSFRKFHEQFVKKFT